MPFYDVEIDEERSLAAPVASARRTESQIQESFSMLSSQFSGSGSETSLDGVTDDEASILYSMESRSHPGLKRICEVPMKDDQSNFRRGKKAAEPCQDPERILMDHKIQEVEEMSHKSRTSRKSQRTKTKDDEKPASRSPKTRAIACVLLVALGLTVVLISLLVNHTTNEKAGSKSNVPTPQSDSPGAVPTPQGDSVGARTEAPETELLDTIEALLEGETAKIPTLAPTTVPTSSATDAYSYLLDYLSAFAKREFLLDASRPQGRAFLQVVMDHTDSFTTLSHTQILQTYAVLTLYFATSPNTWDSLFTWTDTKDDICSWDGVVNCLEGQNGEQVVEGIVLANVGIAGALPEEICLLEHLERLDLRSNDLSGIIPVCLTGSKSLKTLLLSDNSFTGYLPTGILLVPTLEELVVSNNSLLGGLGTLIDGMFTKNVYRYGENWRLQRLNLENNLFSGAVPEFFGALGSLKSLTLHGNDLTGGVDADLCGRSLTELTADCREVACACCTTCY